MCARIEHVQIIRYYEISIIKVEIYVSSQCQHSFIGKKVLFVGKSVSLSPFIPRIVKILTRAHTPASSE